MKRTDKVELVSTVASSILAGAMIAVSLITGSIAILAEGIDTVLDAVASFAVLMGLKFSRKHSRHFPEGLYKLENLVALGIGILILISAYEIAREAIDRLISNEGVLDQPWLIIVVMFVVVVVTMLLAIYKGRVGKQENSPSLRADARHSWSDLVASVAIIVGVSLEMAGVPKMDSITALVIVAFLAWSGLGVLLDSVRVLLDASIERDLIAKVRGIVEAHPDVREVLEVIGRNSGSYRFMLVSLIPWDYDLRSAEETSEELKARICKEIGNVDEVLFDFAVDRSELLLCCVPLSVDGDTPAPTLAEASSFALVELDSASGDEISKKELANPVAPSESARGVRVAVFLARRGVDVLIASESSVGGGASHVLAANGIKLIEGTGAQSLNDTASWLADRLP